MEPPAEDATPDQRKDFVQYQLDCIGSDRPILDGLLLLGSGGHERLQGVRTSGRSP